MAILNWQNTQAPELENEYKAAAIPSISTNFTKTNVPKSTTFKSSGLPTLDVGTYKADQTYTPKADETVEGRLSNLLTSDNPYMKAAETAGLQAANKRGLLNSSLAVGASQKSAIEAALPIAQQDASYMQNRGLAGLQGEIDSALSKQGFEQDYGLTGYKGEIDSSLSAQEHEQAGNLANIQGEINANLSNQEFRQNAGLESVRGEIASNQSAKDYRQQGALYSQQGIISSLLSEQESGQAQALEALQQTGRLNEIREQNAGNLSLETLRQSGEMSLSAQEGNIAQDLERLRQQGDINTIEAERLANEALEELRQRGEADLSAQEAQQLTDLETMRSNLEKANMQAEYDAKQQLETLLQKGRENLSAQEAQQAQTLETFVQEQQTYRFMQELAQNEMFKLAEIDPYSLIEDPGRLTETDRDTMARIVGQMSTDYNVQVGNIYSNPDYASDADRTAAVSRLTDAYKAGVTTLASVYGVDVEWPVVATDSGGTIGNDTTLNPNPQPTGGNTGGGGTTGTGEPGGNDTGGTNDTTPVETPTWYGQNYLGYNLGDLVDGAMDSDSSLTRAEAEQAVRKIIEMYSSGTVTWMSDQEKREYLERVKSGQDAAIRYYLLL